MTAIRSQVAASTDRSWVISSRARPSSRRSSSSRASTWAWTITSRAGVGSSAISTRGEQARATHPPLALPPGQLVGVAGRPPGGQADLLQQLPDPGPGLLVGDLVVEVDGLGDLVPDPADGVGGVHGPPV